MKCLHLAPLTACRPLAYALILLALGACSALSPTARPPPAFYTLDAPQVMAVTAVPSLAGTSTRTLLINPTQALAGFDSPRIIYVREPHKLDYFAHSEWVEPPARMMAPLLVTAIERTGAFGAVMLTPGAARGDWRLETTLIRLQHDFQTRPSQVRFTLRALLVDEKTHAVLAVQEFDAQAPAPSEDPQGGVTAAHSAVQTVLTRLARFLAERAL